MLPVSLDCPFYIAHSVFSNVYLPIAEASPLIDEDFFLLRLEVISSCLLLTEKATLTSISPRYLLSGVLLGLHWS